MERELCVQNRLGLHARTASDFARCAARFQCRLQLRVGQRLCSARSAIEVLEAGLDCGCRFQLVADGPDAEAAATALERYLQHLAEIDRLNAAKVRAYRLRRVDSAMD